MEVDEKKEAKESKIEEKEGKGLTHNLSQKEFENQGLEVKKPAKKVKKEKKEITADSNTKIILIESEVPVPEVKTNA